MSQSIETRVTPSTTLILIKNVSTQNIVYLPSYNYADFNVTVRDTTGNSRIVSTPVVLSTTNNSLFFDGSSRYNLNQPYGLVNLALRNSNRWQIVHTSGQSPANSAANVQSVNISTAFFSLVSTPALSLSTLTVENLSTPNSIQLVGPFIIQNLSTPGFVQMQSTLTVYGNTLLNRNLYVSAAGTFLSSVYVERFLPFSSIFSFGAFAIGGNLAVGGTTSLLDTLYTQSTVQAYTVRIQQSTGTVLKVYNTLSVTTQFSTLGYLSVGTSTIASRNATITANVSTLSGTFKTTVLSPSGSSDLIIDKNLQVEGPLIVSGSFYNRNNLAVNNTINISSFAAVNGSLNTIYFSSPSLSTSGSLSTLGPLTVSDTIFVNGGVSTIQTNSQRNLSVKGRFIVNQTISSLNTLYTYGNINVGCNAYLGNISVQSLVVAGDMIVNGNVSLSSAIFKKDVTVTGVMSVDGTTKIGGSVGVAEDAYIGTFLDARVNSYYSSINSIDYLLSNVEITTSSPFTSFTASTLFVSSLYSKQVLIRQGNLYGSNTYASTIYVPLVEAENIALSSLTTNSFIVGRNIPANIDSRFILNVPSYFTKGIQTIELRASTISNATFIGSHVGDGSEIINAPSLSYQYISGVTMLASTITSENIYTSSFYPSTVITRDLLYVQSNVLLPTLRIDPVGYPTVTNTNQILSLTNKTMVINNTVYFDNENSRIGINIPVPRADLDVRGILYASNVSYSSINYIDLSGVTVTLSSLQAGNAYLKDYLQYADSGFYVGNFYPNVEAASSNYPIRIWNSESVYKTNIGFQNVKTASTIVVNSGLLIYGDTQRVGINTINFASPTSTGTIYQPQHTLDVRGSMNAEEGYFSTMNITKQLTTECLEVPNLQMYGGITAFLETSTNTFLTSSTTFLIDRFATFTRQGLGINNAQPTFALDVRGSGFFSTLFTPNLRAKSVGLMYQDL